MHTGRIVSIVVAGILGVAASPGWADQRVWNGAAANANASTPANWVGSVAPTNGDSIVLDTTTNKSMTWDSAAPTLVGSWTQVGYNGTVTVATVYGTSGFTNLAIVGNCVISNGVWTHQVNGSSEQYRLSITVGGDLTIGTNAALDASLKGYSANQGPASAQAVNNNCGGSYGGQAKWLSSPATCNPYGSFIAPTNLGAGSQGGDGTNDHGGGAIFLNVAGTTTLAGQILANGGFRSVLDHNYSAAGGSVYLITGRLTGPGAINAQSGYGNSAGGGGGRIAVMLTNGVASFAEYTGSMSAAAPGGAPGGAGTIYLRAPGQATNAGTLIVDNAGYNTTVGALLQSSASVGDVIIRNSGVLAIASNQSLTVNGMWSNSATLSAAAGAAVIFDGSASSTSTVYGNTVFTRVMCTNAGRMLRFAAGSSNSVQEALTLTGVSGNPVMLRSVTDGAQWKLNVGGWSFSR